MVCVFDDTGDKDRAGAPDAWDGVNFLGDEFVHVFGVSEECLKTNVLITRGKSHVGDFREGANAFDDTFAQINFNFTKDVNHQVEAKR